MFHFMFVYPSVILFRCILFAFIFNIFTNLVIFSISITECYQVSENY